MFVSLENKLVSINWKKRVHEFEKCVHNWDKNCPNWEKSVHKL